MYMYNVVYIKNHTFQFTFLARRSVMDAKAPAVLAREGAEELYRVELCK